MSESASVRSAARSSTFLNRPHIAPLGPRVRQTSFRASRILETSITSPSATTSISLNLSEFGVPDVPTSPSRTATSPLTSSNSPEPSVASSRRSLAILEEETSSPESAPAYLPDVDTVDTLSEPQPCSKPEIKVVAVVPPPKLIPPPPIKFQPPSVQWKGLPMEAALWTVDSRELQELVSRAIRASARESFIRLLTVENLDVILPAELERLDELKARTQSKYRFLVHRRTMLFHALNSTNLGHQKDGEDGVKVVSRLTSQLAETITECEQNLEEVININDQMAQINKLIDVHWGGALAIALRKLNTSYGRRTSDLKTARERIKQLEAELEDAWKEAEKMAGELDDYEAAIAADDTEVFIETAEIVPVPKSPTINRRSSIPMPMTPTLLAITSIPPSTTPKTPLSPTSPKSQHFSFPPQVHLKAKETEAADVPDTVSIRSARSTRSAKSTRSRKSSWTADSTHTSSVHAAKKRSQRASQSSLRLNTGHTRRQSSGHARAPNEETPPVPDLPLQFASINGVMKDPAANASSTLLSSFDLPRPPLRRQVSLDSVITSTDRVPTAPSVYRGRAADDLYVRLKNQNPSASEIQLVPRTPAPAQSFAAAIFNSRTIPARQPPKDPSKGIPSMWMNADVVKPQVPQTVSPATPTPSPPPRTATSIASSEQNESNNSNSATAVKRQSSMRSATYNKLRGLTKRYSVSLPLFNMKSDKNLTTSRRSG